MTAVRADSVDDGQEHESQLVVPGRLERDDRGRLLVVRLARDARQALDPQPGEDLRVECGDEVITGEVERDASGRLLISLACTPDDPRRTVLVRRPRCA